MSFPPEDKKSIPQKVQKTLQRQMPFQRPKDWYWVGRGYHIIWSIFTIIWFVMHMHVNVPHYNFSRLDLDLPTFWHCFWGATLCSSLCTMIVFWAMFWCTLGPLLLLEQFGNVMKQARAHTGLNRIELYDCLALMQCCPSNYMFM